jgi:23S rRNA (guanosine2251-2'-O)-methyltransferase
MIIYGLNPVLEALRSHPERVRYVGIARDQGQKFLRAVDTARDARVSVRQIPAVQLDRLAAGGVHNGIVAEVTQTEYADFQEMVDDDATRFVLLLDSIQDPQNLGAILRVADGFGVDLVVIPEHESVGLTPAAVKASAGASQWVRVAQVTNLSRAIEALKRREFWVYAAAAGGDRIDEVDLKGKVALVVGNEGKGIRRNVLEHCDRTIAIPMTGHVDSFNVATATAVIAYEVVRQQGRTETDP